MCMCICVCINDHPITPSYQTLAEETASKEIYEDTHSLLREMLTEMSLKVEVGLSFKFSKTEKSMINTSLSGNFGYEKKEMIRKVTEFSNTVVRVSQ